MTDSVYQGLFVDIDENAHGGIDLANMLDKASLAIRAGHMGQVRPSYAVPGLEWIKVTNVADLSVGLWEVKKFDGVQDITLYSIDPVNHKIIFGGNNLTSAYVVGRTDNNADIFEIFRNVNTVSTLSSIYTQLNDADATKTFGRSSVKSTNVAAGAEAAKYTIDLIDAGVLKEVFSIDNKGTIKTFLSGSQGAPVVSTATGELKRITVDHAVDTDYFGNTFLVRNGSLYLVLNDFKSHLTDFNQDLPNLRFITKDFTADLAAVDSGYNVKNNLGLTSGSTISLEGKKMEYINISSTTTNIDLSLLPFGNDPVKFHDGQVITLVNVSENQHIKITHNNVDYGYVGNGDITLKTYSLVEFVYNSTLKRFLAKSINF